MACAASASTTSAARPRAPRASGSGHWPRITSVGVSALCTIPEDTEPSSADATRLRPREPATMSAAPCRSAASEISCQPRGLGGGRALLGDLQSRLARLGSERLDVATQRGVVDAEAILARLLIAHGGVEEREHASLEE